MSEGVAARHEAVFRKKFRAFTAWVNVASHIGHSWQTRVVDVLMVAVP